MAHEQLMHLIADHFMPGAGERDKQEKEKDRLYAEHQEAVAESMDSWKRLEAERKQAKQLKAILLRKEANIRKEEESLRKCTTKEEEVTEEKLKCVQGDSMGRSLEEAQKARSERKKALNQVAQTHLAPLLQVSTDRSYAGVASQQGKSSIPQHSKNNYSRVTDVRDAIVDVNTVRRALNTKQQGTHIVPFSLEETRRHHRSSLPLQLEGSEEIEVYTDGSLVDTPLSQPMGFGVLFRHRPRGRQSFEEERFS
ncbi:hypothetical protein IW140_004487 [Coemansia sp. RSA 1813]|nr:hypothetical protein EV178_004699 [Coemansia sp. RSA 1646]KAJ1771150.1 hypothetical protein LPJ74_002538 [Coemansia sp. RSA 1843]KAJ2087826.1 hypothetical protein IW138_004722 [Coemansia sp. RSA 986]KAJ2212718.1 hypothetical protein EV179_004467 [Coemansia sp. RSA 487]KAJ2567355.1 hypothetical protein IW140_004487 [Coemansia sp. RSA 1813]